MTFENAIEDWESHDDWRYADRDAERKFFYLAGQASAEQRVKELEGDCAILRHAYAEAIKAQVGEPFGYLRQTSSDTNPPHGWAFHFTKRNGDVPVFTHPTTERRETLLDAHARQVEAEESGKFQLGDKVFKPKGSQWHGKIVGTYSTALTPEGYAVESSTEIGSVQIYPAAALEKDE